MADERIIRPERLSDRAAIFEVNRLAFGRDDEARLVDALRDGGFARLSLVAESQDPIVGHILFSEVTIRTETGSVTAPVVQTPLDPHATPADPHLQSQISDPQSTESPSVLRALALAPIAVLPAHQKRGIGSALIQRGLADARAAGHRIVIVLGEPAFYRRFGFRKDLAAHLRSPFPPEYLMAIELAAHALDEAEGEVIYPPAFGLDLPAE
jgi:putative acetyltransferase